MESSISIISIFSILVSCAFHFYRCSCWKFSNYLICFLYFGESLRVFLAPVYRISKGLSSLRHKRFIRVKPYMSKYQIYCQQFRYEHSFHQPHTCSHFNGLSVLYSRVINLSGGIIHQLETIHCFRSSTKIFLLYGRP